MVHTWRVRAGVAGVTLLPLLTGGAWLSTRNTGAVVRLVTVGASPSTLAVASRSSRVFVVNTASDSVSMLDARTGKLLGTIAVGSSPQAAAVDEASGLVFVPNFNSGTVSVLDARTGRLMRTVYVGSCPDAVVVAEHSGRVFVHNSGTIGSIGVLDARNGTLLGTITQSGASLLTLLNEPVDAPVGQHLFVVSKSYMASQPSVLIGQPFIAVLDTASARVVGTITLAGDSTLLTVDTRGNRLTTSNDRGAVRVLDGTTGSLVRALQLGRRSAAMTVDGPRGHIIVVDDTTGRVAILDEATGALLHTRVVQGATGSVAVVARAGRIYVISSRSAGVDGRISILDAVSGRLLRTVSVGRTPVALAVDAQTGRAFVINQAGADPVQQSRWEAATQQIGHWLPWLSISKPPPPPAGAGSVSVLDAT